jgi:hypothetical protein
MIELECQIEQDDGNYFILYIAVQRALEEKKRLFTDYRCVFAFKILLLNVRHWHIRFHGDFNNISFNTNSSTLCIK